MSKIFYVNHGWLLAAVRGLPLPTSYLEPFGKHIIFEVRFEVSKNGTHSKGGIPPALQVSSCIGERWIFSDQWHRKFGGLAPSLAEDLGLKPPVLQREVKTLNTSQQTKMFSWHSRKCEWIKFWRSSSFRFETTDVFVRNHESSPHVHPFPSLKPAATNLSIKAMATAHRPQRSQA